VTETVIQGERMPSLTDCPCCAKRLVAKDGVVRCSSCAYRIAHGEKMPRIAIRDEAPFRIVNVSYPGEAEAIEFKLDIELAKMVADALL
jgi:uncharacterized Zn finger protein (UPF0148 family)